MNDSNKAEERARGYATIEMPTKSFNCNDPMHAIQVIASGQLMAIGIFSPRQKGKNYGEVHLFRSSSSGTWKPLRTYQAERLGRLFPIYWTGVAFTSIDHDGVAWPVLQISRRCHEKDTMLDTAASSLLIPM